MKYFVTEIYPQNRYTAAIARADAEQMLLQSNYEKIDLHDNLPSFFTRLKAYKLALQIAYKLQKADTVFFHFPVQSRVKKWLLFLLRQKGIQTIACIHDLEGWRSEQEQLKLKELALLRLFSVAIVPNKVMQQWLQAKLQHLIYVPLQIFDYPVEAGFETIERQKTKAVAFAGNLKKAPFVHKLSNIRTIHFFIYGQAEVIAGQANCTLLHGVDAKLLPFIIKGSFGLVWDGDSLDTCTSAGRYLMINTPHKLSLYIMAGLPVIIWSGAAMASWVQQKGIGLLVDSLYEISEKIDALSEEAYRAMRQQEAYLQAQMATGTFLKTAITEIEKKLC